MTISKKLMSISALGLLALSLNSGLRAAGEAAKAEPAPAKKLSYRDARKQCLEKDANLKNDKPALRVCIKEARKAS